jgi:hypothetical protein
VISTYFSNSICFMCFLFGRLVCKQFTPFFNTEWFLSYFTFYPTEKIALSFKKFEKITFFKIVRKGYQEKRTFALILKKVGEL